MTNTVTNFFNTFLQGFGFTLISSLIAGVLSLALGTIFAVLQILPSKLVKTLARIYIEIFRNIPLLVVTMFFFLVGASFTKVLSEATGNFLSAGFIAGTIGLTLYTSAFMAETVRAGINSIDGGQMEGARANGLSFWQALQHIVLPQAFRVAIPSLGNQFINLVKNSSILAFVGGLDIMYQANFVASQTFDVVSAYLLAGAFYLVLTLPISYYMQHLENKLKAGA